MTRFAWLLRNNKEIAAEGCFWRLVFAFFLSFIAVPVAIFSSIGLLDLLFTLPDFHPTDTILTFGLTIWMVTAIFAWIYVPAALAGTWALLRFGFGGFVPVLLFGLILAYTQTGLILDPFSAPQPGELFIDGPAWDNAFWLGPLNAALTWFCLRFIHPRLFNQIISSPA